MKHRLILALVCGFALLLAGCQTVSGGTYVLQGGQTISGDLTFVGGDSTLEPGSRVTGSVFVQGGNIRANGEVDGDVALVGGNISFGPTAVVRGVVQNGGGSVHVAQGATIRPPENGPVAGNRWAGNTIGTFLLIPLLLVVALILAVTMRGTRDVIPQTSAGQPAAEAQAGPGQGSATGRSASGVIVAGAILIAIGVLIFFQEIVNVEIWQQVWPIFILVPGLLCFAVMFLSGKNDGRLAVPGSILATLGLIFLVQNTFNHFQSWAYAWALLLASAGLGRFIQGWWSDRPDLRESGLIQARNGLVLFVILAAFFELVLNLSGWFWGDVARFAFPALLILGGILLLSGRVWTRPALRS